MPEPLIVRHPDILGGTPVFAGTRVPADTLAHYLEAGDSIEDFLDDFPSVRRDQAVRFIEEASALLVAAAE